METIDCIKTRRSTRKFLDQQVPDELIERLIDCARYAPSSHGQYTSEFIVVKDADIKKRLSDVRQGMNESAIMSSSALIVICNDQNKSRWLEDSIFAAANIWLGATDLGLGAVYTTAFNNIEPKITETIKGILKLPKDILPICIIPVGYPDPSEESKEKHLKLAGEIVHHDVW